MAIQHETSFTTRDVRQGPPASSSQRAIPSTSTPPPRILRTRDLTVICILTLLFLSNLAGAQFGGPTSFLYWGIGLLTFLLPIAYVTQWLARRFPGAGAPSQWATRLLGHEWSFFTTFATCFPGLLIVVTATLTSFGFLQYLLPTSFTTPLIQGVALLILLALISVVASLPMRWLKSVLFAAIILQLSIYALLGIAACYWLAQGHSPAVAFLQPKNWQMGSRNFGVFGIVILALIGVHLPWTLGGEANGGAAQVRKSTNFVWGAISFIAYLVGSFGVLCIVPSTQTGLTLAPVQAISTVYGPLLASLVAGGIALTYFAIAVAFLLMLAHLLVTAAHQGYLPKALGRINRRGVPLISILIQAITAAFTLLLTFVVIPSLFQGLQSPTAVSQEIYSVLMASVSVLLTAATNLLFVFVIKICFKRLVSTTRRERFVLLLMAGLGIGVSLVGIWLTISSSWLPQLISDTYWRLFVSGFLLVSIVIGWLGSALPRTRFLLTEQKQMTHEEVGMRQELERLYLEQSQAAITDVITGLPNHRAIMATFDLALDQSKARGESCAVMFVDLDHFKEVNDTWGHHAGDSILREMGQRLRNNVRLEDLVGRYAGEEFALLLWNSGEGEAMQLAERLRSVIADEPYWWDAEDGRPPAKITVSGSFGIAIYGAHGTNKNALIEQADLALYQAKQNGRNRVCMAGAIVSSTLTEPGSDGDEGQDITLRALLAAARLRDENTGEHAQRMVEYAEATARLLDCSEKQVQAIRLGAMLHDIGKIGIPDAILRKPGPLNDDEWNIMHRHPLLGQELLVQVGGNFEALAQIVVAHHERWDGRGYPHQLLNEAIPLGARILTVIDSYDAMISKRSYKNAMPQSDACAELLRCSGHQFDPQVVNAFLQVLVNNDGREKDVLSIKNNTAIAL
jgi:diguanylate cyclase (GGDEF)-like protein